MLEAQLKHIDFLDEQITKLDEEVKARMLSFEEDLKRLDTIPGIGRRNAEQILAEIGTIVCTVSSHCRSKRSESICGCRGVYHSNHRLLSPGS